MLLFAGMPPPALRKAKREFVNALNQAARGWRTRRGGWTGADRKAGRCVEAAEAAAAREGRWPSSGLAAVP